VREMSDHLRPAAVKAGVLRVAEDGTVYDASGNPVKRFGFHNLRHSLSTALPYGGKGRFAHGGRNDCGTATAGPRWTCIRRAAWPSGLRLREIAEPDSAAERVGELNGTENGTGFSVDRAKVYRSISRRVAQLVRAATLTLSQPSIFSNSYTARTPIVSCSKE